MNNFIRFLIFISLIFIINGFPEGQKEEEKEKVKALPGAPTDKLKDLKHDEYELCPNPSYSCYFSAPVCICYTQYACACCPLDRPNYWQGYCY